MGNRSFISGVCLFFFTSSLTITISSSQASESKKYVPTAQFNGSSWHGLERINEEQSPLLKTCLVRGIYEGSFALDPLNAYEQYGPWVSFADLVRSLDRFYAEERNLKIPVTYALVLISKKAQGNTLQTITGSPAERKESGNTLVSLESHI